MFMNVYFEVIQGLVLVRKFGMFCDIDDCVYDVLICVMLLIFDYFKYEIDLVDLVGLLLQIVSEKLEVVCVFVY